MLKRIKNNLLSKVNNYLIINVKHELTANFIYLQKAAITHQKTFGPFKDYCKGKSVVVCGAGPSLNNYKPIKDAFHIAVNRAFLFDKVHFDFIFSQDFDGIRMVQNELVKYQNSVKLLGQICQRDKEIPESLARECNALRFYLNDYLIGGYQNCHFVKDIDMEPISGFPVVGMSVMQFVLYMNPTDIYLVGMDTSGGHFANPSQSQNDIAKENANLDVYWKNEYDLQIKKWKELISFRDCFYPDIKIHSINPVGLKGIFDDIFQ